MEWSIEGVKDFDEIFYVDVPDVDTRQKIIEKCINDKRPNDLASIDTYMLANITEGYCGAYIENIVNNALEKAFIFGKHELTKADLCEAIDRLTPLNEQYSKTFVKMEKAHNNYKFKDAQ